MPKYMVRTTCEYSIEVDATSREEALALTSETPLEFWKEDWTARTTEEVVPVRKKNP